MQSFFNWYDHGFGSGSTTRFEEFFPSLPKLIVYAKFRTTMAELFSGAENRKFTLSELTKFLGMIWELDESFTF